MSTNTPQAPPTQTLPIGNVAPETQNAITQLPNYNIGAQFSPNVQSIAQQYLDNPYTAQAQQGVNQFSGYGTANALAGLGAAGQQYNIANAIYGGIPGVSAAANNLFQQANDPQGNIFNWLQNMTQGQTSAALAGAGLGNTPYGASVMGNVQGNLDVNWQNALLQRAIQGDTAALQMLQGAGGLANVGAGLQTGAFNLGQGATGAGYGAAFAPSNALQQILGGQLLGPQQASAYGQQIAAIPQMQIGDYLNQMGQYNQANAVANTAYSNQLQANQDQWNRYVQMAQGAGQLGAAGMAAAGMTPGGGIGAPGTFSAPGTFMGGASGGTGWNAMNPWAQWTGGMVPGGYVNPQQTSSVFGQQ